MFAVDTVVGLHDRLWLCALDRDLKGAQVDLVQRARGDICRHREAAGLLIVDGKMLDTAAHAVSLHGIDVGGGEVARKIRIFREVLEVSAAERGALHVYAGTEDNGYAFGNRFLGNGVRSKRGDLPVPGGSKRRCRRETGGMHRRPLVVYLYALTQTVRSVGHHRAGNAESLHAVRVPGTLAVAEIRLFRSRHFV